MKPIHRLFLPVAAIAFANVSVAAEVLFDNGTSAVLAALDPPLRNTMCAAFDDAGECRNRFTVYDDFVLESPAVISAIQWYQTEQKPENYMGTVITLGVGSPPSEEPPTHTIEAVADRTLTPIPTTDPRFPTGTFESTAIVSGLEIALDAGVYWLGIHNVFPPNVIPQTGGAAQWSITDGTDATMPGRWQGETTICGSFPISPDGGCLKTFPDENSAFQIIGRLGEVVSIDIKPGSDPNCFNINGRGVIPIAVLGSDTFDVSDIDATTLRFGGFEVRVRGNKGPQCAIEYVNSDAELDLVCQFNDDAAAWTAGTDEATLTGETYEGAAFEGTDSICIVP